MINYIIIDDEHIAHDIIKEYCGSLSTMRLKKQCYDAIEALDYLMDNQVDLIFLDLNMPKLKGFDFLKTLSNPPKIIVTTAYQEYALEGYELEVIDYLLKPFSFERFLKAVNKVNQVVSSESSTRVIQEIDDAETEHIFLYCDKKYIQVKIGDILFVEAAGNYSKVVLKNEVILVREKISVMLEKFPSTQFVQVHKSFFIAKNHITSIENNRIVIADGSVPIGKLYKLNVLELIKQ